MTNRIQKIFNKLKAENKKALVTFSVGGYPDEITSLEIAKSIADSGSHIHEISFPHAEAQADGPIIQLANIVDLPSDVIEEKQLKEVLKKENIALIKLITPTTSDERIKEIVKDAEGFVYSVNVEGQTGVKSANLDIVNSQIERIKKLTTIPVVSGFGIKNEEDVKVFSKSKADGIVLGSAIVKKIQEKCHENKDKHIVANFVKDYCKKLIENLNK